MNKNNGFSNILIIVGVIVIGLIVLAFVSGVAKVNVDVSKTDDNHVSGMNDSMKEDDSDTTMMKEMVEDKPYTNTTYGFSLMYPGDWTMQEGTNSDPIVSFNSPKETANDRFSENLLISLTDLSSSPSLTSSDVMDLWVNQNKSDTSFSGFTVTNREQITVSGYDAEQTTYEATAYDYDIKGRVTIVLKGTDAYIMLYSAEKNSYDKYVIGADAIRDSFTL